MLKKQFQYQVYNILMKVSKRNVDNINATLGRANGGLQKDLDVTEGSTRGMMQAPDFMSCLDIGENSLQQWKCALCNNPL